MLNYLKIIQVEKNFGEKNNDKISCRNLILPLPWHSFGFNQEIL